jgi:hypothetical protein
MSYQTPIMADILLNPGLIISDTIGTPLIQPAAE